MLWKKVVLTRVSKDRKSLRIALVAVGDKKTSYLNSIKAFRFWGHVKPSRGPVAGLEE